jgi:hypothetical protein
LCKFLITDGVCFTLLFVSRRKRISEDSFLHFFNFIVRKFGGLTRRIKKSILFYDCSAVGKRQFRVTFVPSTCGQD